MYVPLFTLLALALAGCGDPRVSALVPQGSNARESLSLIQISAYIMFGVMGVVIFLLAVVLIRFRAKPGDRTIPKQVEGSNLLEFIWTAIPVLIITVLSILTVRLTFSMAQDHSDDPNALKLQVIAHQYWWEFRYPDLGIVTAQDLYIPVGKKISVELWSTDVIHSFWVPALTGKMDANPGALLDGKRQNANRFSFDAETVGVFLGKCAELCGPSHALMEFKVVVLPEDEFNRWVEAMKKPAPKPETTKAAAGEQTFQKNCMACHALEATDTANRPGPNLANIGNRLTIAGVLPAGDDAERAASLRRWIEAPNDVKPQNDVPGTVVMPPFKDKLSPEELDQLVDFLMLQKVDVAPPKAAAR
ncbi:MAG: cytochrome c oxidase subunit II [Hydrogenibacillus schlegelii]|nr:cytochrome c oxidase subunit II [Hydrogenibacillus schlegelii]